MTNWQQVFERFRITAEDAIFFPSAEHYGFGALMVLMANLPQELRPKVHARLIAVLEGASAKSEFGRAELFKSVALARKTGVDVSFSAETLAYQDYLKNIFREDIYLLQYPIFGRPTVVNWKKRPFKIVTPGQGRADKGFFEILKLANLLKSSHGEGEVEIVLQKMKPTDVYYRQSYVQSLLEHPMISVKPAFVEEDELDWMYRDSHVLFMPYARDVYAQRGSAVFQEGVSRGRCFIASDGTGVSGMIRHYENGILVKDMQNVADAVSRFMGMSQTEAFAMSHHARCTYQDDFNDQFGRLCGTLSGE
ncbi:MAG: glycosyltransferase [Pseudomonadota bacterium]